MMALVECCPSFEMSVDTCVTGKVNMWGVE